MAKSKIRTQFLCNTCGSVHLKWMGKCPDCGTWDSLEEYKAPTPDARAAAVAPGNGTGDLARGGEALALSEIDEADAPRRPTGIGEFDRVLGGGVVPGSAVLVGGEPGIGKSTLLLQVAHELARGDEARRHGGTEARREPAPALADPSCLRASMPSCLPPAKVLYVTSEESARQTKLRASRLGAVSSPDLLILAETNVERIVNQIHRHK